MKKINMLLAIVMLISVFHLPVAASVINGYADEGVLPYFNTFADAGATDDGQWEPCDDAITSTPENGYLKITSDGITAGKAVGGGTYFKPAYQNTSDDRRPLVLEYKIKFNPGDENNKSNYLTQSNKGTYGVQIYPKTAKANFTSATETQYDLSGSMSDWHTVSLVYSTENNTKKFYWDGEYIATSVDTGNANENLWDDTGKLGTVRFYTYAAKDYTINAYMDSIKLYELPETFDALLFSSDAAELDEFVLDFNSTVSNLSEETITFGGEAPEKVELIDEEKQIYKLTLSENLNPDTEYKVAFNDVSNTVGQKINEEITFRTRKAVINAYGIALTSSDKIKEGENTFKISYVNETEETINPVLVVNSFNEENRMIGSEKIDLGFTGLTEEIIEANVSLSEDTSKAQLYILGADGLTNYSGAYTFDKVNDTVSEELIRNEAASEPSYTYKVSDDTNEMNVEIIGEAEGTANIIVTDENSVVLYKGQHNTTGKKAKFTFRLTDNGTYNLSYKMSGNDKWYTGNIKYFTAEYIAERFKEFNGTDDISKIAEFITDFEEVLMLDTGRLNLIESEEEKKLIYNSLLAQRNELETKKFADSDAVNLALSIAYKLYDVYKGEAYATAVCEDMAEEEFFCFVKENFSEDLTSYFNSLFKGKMYSAVTDFNKAFCDNVILSGIYKGENYSLTTEIIKEFNEYIPLNLSVYSSLKNTMEVDSALSGNNYPDLSALINAFNKETKNRYNKENASIKPSGGGAGGGGGISFGGGASESKNPVEEITPTEPEKNFSDLSGYEWAEKAINVLYEKSVVNGVSEKTFNPGGVVKREEFVKMIDCLYEAESTPSEFTDVNQDAWYASYINKAVSAGIIKGTDASSFGIGLGVTRQDMAVMIYRLLKPEEVVESELFADDEKISGYAKEAVYYLKNKGIISGTGNGNYEPERTMTRAEAAVLINNVLNFIG